jgi:hypothetical protein
MIPIPSVTTADINAHTLQALVELVYVRTANEIITSSLAALDTALETTQSSLTTLTGIQGLFNNVAVSKKGTFDFDYVDTPTDDYSDDYTSAASAFFGTPIVPFFSLSSGVPASTGSPQYPGFVSALDGYRSALMTEIAYLSTITVPLDDPNTLYTQLKYILSALPPSDFDAISKWILDGYGSIGVSGLANAGQFQTTLTNAMTAAQSLNNSQTQDVQRYLYLFQQYYQSAAAVLSAINQIITKMASNIASG